MPMNVRWDGLPSSPAQQTVEPSAPEANAGRAAVPAHAGGADDEFRRGRDVHTRITEVLRIARAENAHVAEAQRELEAQHVRLVRSLRTMRAADVWLLAIQHELKAERSRLAAEYAGASRALDGLVSEERRLSAAQEALDARLAAADEALASPHLRCKEMSRPAEVMRVPQTAPSPERPAAHTPASDAQCALEAKRAELMEALEVERARWTATLRLLQEKAQSLAAPVEPTAEGLP